MIGREVGEKCYVPSINVWAAGKLLTSNERGLGCCSLGTVKPRSTASSSLGWLTPPLVGESLTEKLDRQHMVLGVQMFLQV